MGPRFRQLLRRGTPFENIAVYDVPSARLVEIVGFPSLFLGSSKAGEAHGLPDWGLLSLHEQVGFFGHIAQRVDIPAVADIDVNSEAIIFYRAVKQFAQADVAAVHFGDQIAAGGRQISLRSVPVMVDLIHAARDASPDVVVSVRCQGLEAEKIDRTLERAARYVEALGLSAVDAAALAGDKASGDFFEHVVKQGVPAKRATVLMEALREMSNERSRKIADLGLSPDHVAQVGKLVESGKIAASKEVTRKVLDGALASPALSIEQVAQNLGLVQTTDTGVALGTLIPTVAECLGLVLPYAMRVIGARVPEVLKEILAPALLTDPPRPCQNVVCRSFSVTRAGSSARSPISKGDRSLTDAATRALLVMALPTPINPSSVTTSTTECEHVQPFSSTVGVCTRTLAVPCGRSSARR